MKPVVFLDRDGTINEDVGYLFTWERLKFVPRAIEAMLLMQNRFDLFVITNQTGIGERVFTMQEYQNFEGLFKTLLAAHGVEIKKTYCCPHLKAEGCLCLKPGTYFLMEAAKEYGIDLSASYAIGDHPHDIEMGKNAGIKTVYVLSGHGLKHRSELTVQPDYIANDLYDASGWILAQDQKGG